MVSTFMYAMMLILTTGYSKIYYYWMLERFPFIWFRRHRYRNGHVSDRYDLV